MEKIALRLAWELNLEAEIQYNTWIMFPEKFLFNITNAPWLKKERLKGMVSSWYKLFSLVTVKVMHLGWKKKNPTNMKQLEVTLHWKMKHGLWRKHEQIFFLSFNQTISISLKQIRLKYNFKTALQSATLTCSHFLSYSIHLKSHILDLTSLLGSSHLIPLSILQYFMPRSHSPTCQTNTLFSCHFIQTYHIHLYSCWPHRASASGQDRKRTRSQRVPIVYVGELSVRTRRHNSHFHSHLVVIILFAPCLKTPTRPFCKLQFMPSYFWLASLHSPSFLQLLTTRKPINFPSSPCYLGCHFVFPPVHQLWTESPPKVLTFIERFARTLLLSLSYFPPSLSEVSSIPSLLLTPLLFCVFSFTGSHFQLQFHSYDHASANIQ